MTNVSEAMTEVPRTETAGRPGVRRVPVVRVSRDRPKGFDPKLVALAEALVDEIRRCAPGEERWW